MGLFLLINCLPFSQICLLLDKKHYIFALSPPSKQLVVFLSNLKTFVKKKQSSPGPVIWPEYLGLEYQLLARRASDTDGRSEASGFADETLITFPASG